MAEHGWTQHGHRCCDQATGPRPARVARCGGPVLCRECAADAAIRHAPASGRISTSSPPDDVYAAADRAFEAAADLADFGRAGVRAAVDSAYAAGVAADRAQAAADIRAYADHLNVIRREDMARASGDLVYQRTLLDQIWVLNDAAGRIASGRYRAPGVGGEPRG